MPKHTSAVDATPVRVVMVTLDSHLAGATDLARSALAREVPGLELKLYSASEWCGDPAELDACRADIARADIIFASMLFMEDHVEAVRDALEARRPHCDAMICCLAAPEVSRLTRMGSLDMSKSDGGGLALLKKLRGKPKDNGQPATAGARQMAVLRRLPQILRFIPGTAQDLRIYFLAMRYWLLGSQDNITNLIRLLVGRYASGPRKNVGGRCKADAPVEYPEVGVYHPQIAGRIGSDPAALPRVRQASGRVGLIVMRSYVLAGNTAHYDGVIDALQARGLEPVPAFSSGLDAREAVEAFFIEDGRPTVDAVVSLTGFSLVGGPAYNDSAAAEALLSRLDVPYLSAQALEFQTLEQWQASERGLLPLEATMMVAIPELDGAGGAMVYGGRSRTDGADARRMAAHPERAATLAERVRKLVDLRRSDRAERKVAVVLFDFPPNSGGTGSAAHLAVFPSLFNTLERLAREGYRVELPESVAELRDRLLNGNRDRYGSAANVHTEIPLEEHVAREPHLAEIEAQWGPAPGRIQTDGSNLQVLGARFGNVFVGVQPGFGYEGDPMRMLFERGFAPTHAFAAFYRYIKHDFGAAAVLHFGTHGALEFMPGKQAGLSAECWPDRLIGALPNLYLYAANNPSEGSIAKRRAQATTITYLTPPVAEAGLYQGLSDLRGSLNRFRAGSSNATELERLAALIQAQAAALDLDAAEPAWEDAEVAVEALRLRLDELEHTLIPCGLHVVGAAPDAADRRGMVEAMARSRSLSLDAETLEVLVDGDPQTLPKGETTPELTALARSAVLLRTDTELDAIVHALDGGYVAPVVGGDLLRNPDILPTGRNLHGFDPMRLPSRFAVSEGRRQADCLLERYRRDGAALPETLAMVLWGTDNLKTEGVAIGQALALIGAAPRMDSYGRLAGADLIPLDELGRGRIDVVITLSGIFRDLLPNQTRLLADAALKAAEADEPLELNPIRRHALAYQQAHGGTLADAALRVFSNADGAYGANVNMMVDNGVWQDEGELGEMFTRRKCFAYGTDSTPTSRPELLADVLGHVELTYQNLDSLELGVTTVDHYFDSLGGISRAVRQARGQEVPTFIGDHTQGAGTVRSLSDQVALETRTRILNPHWYEEMLEHGYEGVHQIEVHITNTMGWSATTGQVAPWVYRELSNTFVLDEVMRNRLAELNPTASMRLANRLLEAQERAYWSPEPGMLDALQRAGEALEDRLEGITQGAAA
ncbi:MAG: magnesium chelatase subunit H [Pseudomonadales bacterium]